MTKLSPKVEMINQIVEDTKNLGILQLRSQKTTNDGRTVIIDGKTKTYFGNCSYLGLELDDRVKQGAINAINDYGTYFSCSRAYVEIPLMAELELLFEQMFKKPCIVAPTTTLGHIANIPIIIGNNDVVILDHQVHTSVANAAQIVKASGVRVEVIRHSRLDHLERRINELKDKYDKIWYMADGIYSIYGDTAPMAELNQLMEKYDQFWCYIDDAHGMSWTGEHGTGYALSQISKFPDKLVLVTSLAKGFGVCGSVLIFPNRKMKEVVRNCGPSLMFSGPPQPSTLGASIECCKIHLTNEIYEKQQKLSDLMNYFVMTARGLNLPLISHSKTPIFFIGVGASEMGREMIVRMFKQNYLLNLSTFPSVPHKNAGLRATITTNHTIADIYEMLTTLSDNLNDMEQKKKVSKKEIFKAFALSEY